MEINIFNIDQAVRQALDAIVIDEETGEIIGWDHAQEVCTASLEKLGNTAKYVKTLTAQVAAMKEAEKDIAARRKSAENLASRLSDMIAKGMTSLDINKINGADIAVSFRKNPPAVEVIDEAQIPAQFWVLPPTKPVLDKATIKERLKGGEDIPGAKLSQSERLVIK